MRVCVRTACFVVRSVVSTVSASLFFVCYLRRLVLVRVCVLPPVERCIRAVKQVNESVWPVLKRRLDTRRPDGDQKKNTRYNRQRLVIKSISHRKSPTGQLCQTPVLAGHLSRTPAEDPLGVACHVPSHKRGNAQIAYNCVLI